MRKVSIAVALLLLGVYGTWQLSRARTFQLFGETPWYRGRERSRAAVPAIIENLKSRGYTFLTVDELLRMRQT